MADFNKMIWLLSQDSDIPSSSRGLTHHYTQFYAFGAGLAVLVGAAVLYMLGLSIRPGYFTEMFDPIVAAKQVLPLLVIIGLMPLARITLYPEVSPDKRMLTGLAPLVAMLGLFVVCLAVTPSEDWGARFIGDSLVRCLLVIPMIGVVLLGVLLLALRRGAPSHAVMSGLIAGLIAGSTAAVLYGLVCVEDSPLFFGFWYSAGILLTGGLGAISGKFTLRW